MVGVIAGRAPGAKLAPADRPVARRVRLVAFRVDGATTAIEATLSAPSAEASHLIRLLKETGVEKLDLGFGADARLYQGLRVGANVKLNGMGHYEHHEGVMEEMDVSPELASQGQIYLRYDLM